MKVLLTTLNSKYIHTNLALRYLKRTIEDSCDVEIKEFTINEHNNDILREVITINANVIAFSCYIWNIEQILKLASDIKKINKETKIILGGPEVSYKAKEILENNKYIDYIISGEGEEAFPKLIDRINRGEEAENDLSFQIVENLESIKSPYEEFEEEEYKNKLVYYETSRGCPFKCSYCLSSTTNGVRFFPIERVKEELVKFFKAEVRTIKFLDRTFNINTKRTLEIWKFIVENNINSICHFEIEPILINDEMLEFLKTVPKGMFNFEIGIQTTNKETLRAIDRNDDVERAFEVIKKLQEYDNIHLHLDLIAGLPKEDYESFKKSFNDVYSLGSEVIQLGFLKLLHGTKIRNNIEDEEYVFSDNTPYEIFCNKYISYSEILELKKVEHVLEIYKNSGRFKNALKYLSPENPFDFYKSLAEYWDKNGYFNRKVSGEEAFDILDDYINSEVFSDILKLDYIQKYSTRREWFNENRINLKEVVANTLGNTEFREKHLPEYKDEKEILKKVKVELFRYNVLGDFEEGDYAVFIDKETRRIITSIQLDNKEKRIENKE